MDDNEGKMFLLLVGVLIVGATILDRFLISGSWWWSRLPFQAGTTTHTIVASKEKEESAPFYQGEERAR